MVYVVKSGKSIGRSCVIVLIDSDFCVKIYEHPESFCILRDRYMPKSLMTYWFACF